MNISTSMNSININKPKGDKKKNLSTKREIDNHNTSALTAKQEQLNEQLEMDKNDAVI